MSIEVWLVALAVVAALAALVVGLAWGRARARRAAREPFLALARQLEGPGWNVSEGFETGIREAATLIRQAAAGAPLRYPPVTDGREGYLLEQRCPRCLTLTAEELADEDRMRGAL